MDPTRPGAEAPDDADHSNEQDDDSDQNNESSESDEAPPPDETAPFDDSIQDPERPGTGDPSAPGKQLGRQPEGEDVIEDPTRPGSSPNDETIVDPARPDSDDDESIVDPSRPGGNGSSGPAHGTVPAQGDAQEDKDSDFLRIGYLVGRFRHLSSIDTRFDNSHEDVMEFRNELSFGIRFDATKVTSALLEARFTHWFTVEKGSEGQDFLDDVDGVFNVELREAWLRFSFDEIILTLGNQFILWGTTDIFSPTQVVHRRDFRYGVPFENTEDLIPVFAFDTKWFAADGLTIEAWLQPFFSGSRSQIFGNDFSIVSPGSPLAASLGVAEVLDDLVDNNGGEAIDTAFQSFSVPDAAIENLSVGARIAGSFAGIDLGAAYVYGWDDTPDLSISEDLSVLVRAILANPEVLQTLDPRPILLEPGVINAVANLLGQAIDSLLFSDYQRLHTIALDFQTYLGPVGIRLEGTFNPNKTYLVLQDATAPGGLFQDDESFRQLSTSRLGDLYGVLGVSWESADTRWFVTTEGFYRRLFGLDESAGEEPLLGARDLYGLGLGIRMEPIDDLQIEVGGVWTITFLEDVVVTTTVTWEIVSGLSILARHVLFNGPDIDDDITIGSVYENNDHVTLGLDWTF